MNLRICIVALVGLTTCLSAAPAGAVVGGERVAPADDGVGGRGAEAERDPGQKGDSHALDGARRAPGHWWSELACTRCRFSSRAVRLPAGCDPTTPRARVGDTDPMTASQIQPETLLADRERWVARGVSAPAIVAVSADGAHVQGADGVRYLDFAGGIGCQNLGHNPEAVVEAIHAQVDAYLHQCC